MDLRCFVKYLSGLALFCQIFEWTCVVLSNIRVDLRCFVKYLSGIALFCQIFEWTCVVLSNICVDLRCFVKYLSGLALFCHNQNAKEYHLLTNSLKNFPTLPCHQQCRMIYEGLLFNDPVDLVTNSTSRNEISKLPVNVEFLDISDEVIPPATLKEIFSKADYILKTPNFITKAASNDPDMGRVTSSYDERPHIVQAKGKGKTYFECDCRMLTL